MLLFKDAEIDPGEFPFKKDEGIQILACGHTLKFFHSYYRYNTLSLVIIFVVLKRYCKSSYCGSFEAERHQNHFLNPFKLLRVPLFFYGSAVPPPPELES